MNDTKIAEQPLALDTVLSAQGPLIVGGVPEGLDALALGALANSLAQADADKPAALIHVARDGQRMNALEDALRFFAPRVKLVVFPAWDCVPYDRISPNSDIAARRLTALAQLALRRKQKPDEPVIVLTTVNAVLQLVPPRDYVAQSVLRFATGATLKMDEIIGRLECFGYVRSSNVMEPGEYAVRGGILDLFPPSRIRPVRLDFFGDTLDSIRSFDPDTQRTRRTLKEFMLLPVSEVPETEEARRLFRQNYVELFGPARANDPLYESISAGTRYQGMEHWLPLFHTALESLLDYAPGAWLSFDHLADEARVRRKEQIADHFEARQAALEQKSFGAPPYKPVPPERMFFTNEAWDEALAERRVIAFSPFERPETQEGATVVSLHGRRSRNFAAERAQEGVNVFDAAVAHIRRLTAQGKRAVVACWSNGARERFKSLLADHGLDKVEIVETIEDVNALSRGTTGLAIVGLETGFETPDLAVVGEQDILGDRLVRPRRQSRRGAEALTEASTLSAGDLVVHSEHGIGRFEGLRTIEAAGAPHDCLELVYHGGDKLFLPVENIELLTRYGSDEGGAVLDRLGGTAWQSRKARLKNRIRDIAEKLIKVAAMRELRQAPVISPQDGAYQEFSARFPYEETDDQRNSIDAVLHDLGSGRPMDRLICGDVGFGKTEVALRSAFVTVMEGKQVAVVVPTTLLARQHHRTFVERFRGLPVRIAQASRLVGSKELAEVRKGLACGEINIVVGTHALLGKSIQFQDLGLLIIDEEQHFGVRHKERLKELRGDVHVLTLTATPIPRTLQLALSGVRELSLIATPPVDRMAVRTYVTPFDPVIIREALLRERYRGGQSFYVCPRISDLDEAAAFLAEHVPELKVGRAHGQMAPGMLDDVMNAFYDRQYDVLLCTTIVESGLDIPTANTLIVHRSDMFGLAQLYQLRGRVGRSKFRAYAYFTVSGDARLTPTAEKRLKVLQSLDTLGAGFSLASHDLDIRGAGNLLGEEQSGHIREVGFELYQSMLEEAVASLKGGEGAEVEEQWSPRIQVGTAVLIPEAYVPDLQIRLGLYKRLSTLENQTEINAFAAELVDRFGKLPEEVEHLLEIVKIKGLCRQANIAQVEAGPKGAIVAFRDNVFANPEGLIQLATGSHGRIRLQPDRLVFKGTWKTPEERLAGALSVVRQLADLAAAAKKAA